MMRRFTVSFGGDGGLTTSTGCGGTKGLGASTTGSGGFTIGYAGRLGCTLLTFLGGMTSFFELEDFLVGAGLSLTLLPAVLMTALVPEMPKS